MWAFGCCLLELVTGFPLWMSLKSRACTTSGKSVIGKGIFGVPGRTSTKILAKHSQCLKKNLPQTLKKYECYGLDKDSQFIDLVNKMLDEDPRTRISPKQVLKHPFVTNS